MVCPICGEGIHIHGFYDRKLRFGEDKVLIKILKVKCIGCNRTHEVIPDFVSPRKHFSAAVSQQKRLVDDQMIDMVIVNEFKW